VRGERKEGASAPSTFLDAALDLAQWGLSVFPLAERSKLPKIPKVDGGNGVLDATRDEDQIREWWGRWPEANIGVRTGELVDVLDVDSKDGAAGFSSLVGLIDAHGCLPTSAVSVTPTGGLHYFFTATGAGNRAGILPGLDWRGTRGYVVAPPSITRDGVYEWGLVAEVAEAPDWLKALVVKPEPVTRTVGTGKSFNATAYARRALENEIGRLHLVAVGARNHQLNTAAFNLGQLVAVGALDAMEVVEELAAHAAQIGLEPTEITATIRSGLTEGMKHPRKVS
jgi:hypothetical protein